MAAINCSVSTRWNDTKCQRLAGLGSDEFPSHIMGVQDVGKQPEKNGKYKYCHISSNGYYGYLPVMSYAEDYAMDTNDASAENSMGNGRDPKNERSISALTNMQHVNGNILSVGISIGRRKRICEEDNSTEEPKRQRQEGNLFVLRRTLHIKSVCVQIFFLQ